MSSSSLIRLAGLAALGSGVLSAIGDLLTLVVSRQDPQSATTTSYTVDLLYLLSTALLLLGLVGLYTSQSRATGLLGLVGFLTAFLGTVLLVGTLWFEVFVTPSLAAQDPEVAESVLAQTGYLLMLLFGAVGWILFGVATLRARVYPGWAAILLIVGVVIAFLPIPLVGLVFSVAVAYLGYLLFTGRVRSGEQPSRVS
jgi:hypothetical protein